MTRLERLERLAGELLLHSQERQRLSRQLIAAGVPGLRNSSDDAAAWQAIHRAIDELEAQAHSDRLRLPA